MSSILGDLKKVRQFYPPPSTPPLRRGIPNAIILCLLSELCFHWHYTHLLRSSRKDDEEACGCYTNRNVFSITCELVGVGIYSLRQL